MPQRRWQKDHQHFSRKVALREAALAQAGLSSLVVCETCGGQGRLVQACYRDATGVVFDIDDMAIATLAAQRPTWRVYQADAAIALAGGIASDLPYTILDCDPYGSPWTMLEGFFRSPRVFAPTMVVVLTDGSRQKQRLGGLQYGWESWQDRYGRNLFAIYLRCCQERLALLVSEAGYRVAWWHGRYGGHSGQMAYCAAVLRQPAVAYTDGPAQG